VPYLSLLVTSDVVTARITSQLLAGPKPTKPEAVVERLLAVQAQDARGARLAIRARSRKLTVDAIDDAFTKTRSLVITWLNRGTLHLVTAPDYWWLHALTAVRTITANERRLRQEGVSPKQAATGIDVVLDAVNANGPQTRHELRQVLDDARVPTKGQALIHLLLAASLHHDLVRGPMHGTEQAFVSATAWVGPPPRPLEREDALALLVRRYLAGHAPAEPEDLAVWSGLPLTDARRAFDETGLAWSRRKPRALPSPTLLGPFDPLLHGWASRAPIVGEHQPIITTNGIFRPIALVEGRAVATWSLAAGTITIAPLEPLNAATRRSLEHDATDVLRFLGLAPRPTRFAT
jgi:winged helix DNA-binding protein